MRGWARAPAQSLRSRVGTFITYFASIFSNPGRAATDWIDALAEGLKHGRFIVNQPPSASIC
jgi:uncharacterized membrane protein